MSDKVGNPPRQEERNKKMMIRPEHYYEDRKNTLKPKVVVVELFNNVFIQRIIKKEEVKDSIVWIPNNND